MYSALHEAKVGEVEKWKKTYYQLLPKLKKIYISIFVVFLIVFPIPKSVSLLESFHQVILGEIRQV